MSNLVQSKRRLRIVIDSLKPAVDGGRFPIKRVVGEKVRVCAVILCDGHDILRGNVLFRHASEGDWQQAPMECDGNDSWTAEFDVSQSGKYYFTAEAFIDRTITWFRGFRKKYDAGQFEAVDFETGAILLRELASVIPKKGVETVSKWADLLNRASKTMTSDTMSEISGLIKPFLGSESELAQWTTLAGDRSLVRYPIELAVSVDPAYAANSAWYEFFPRSVGCKPGEAERHGTLVDAEKHLDYVGAMGFDVVYLPPIYPIGKKFRKGKNNATTAQPDDVGSPWAIGGAEGGFCSIHPDLGTMADFERFQKRANKLGLKVALDIAFQCSPDHPYVSKHPEWFKKRPDGSIQYAENPPKKYQDIYPFDFECENVDELWDELKSVVLFWVKKGVKIFRVDNPHTKPFHFWEWLIAEVRSEHTDVIFLAEAFTRPHIMSYLAKAGFNQSYTYFTWRTSKEDLTQYLEELTQTDLIEYFRPNFWPNTPDILPRELQSGGRPAFIRRLVLAATLSSSYGVYGPVYELSEGTPRDQDCEEYLDSEKYELKTWNLKRPDSLAPLMTCLNRARKENSALSSNRRLKFLKISNENLIAFVKSSEDGANVVIVVVNLSSREKAAGMIELPLQSLGLNAGASFYVRDLLTEARYEWKGEKNYIELDPVKMPAHVFVLERVLERGQG